MPNILAIETSSKICSVALTVADVLYQETLLAERQHTQQVLSQINSLLHQADITLPQLDAIAFSAGPGSFTGIRLAASLVQGLAYGANVPTIAVSTLQTLAQGAAENDRSAPVGDALASLRGAKRRGNPDPTATISSIAVATNAYGGYIYWGLYQLNSNGIMQAIQPDQRITPEAAHLPATANWLAVGDAWQVYDDVLTQRLAINAEHANRQAYAKDIITLAQADFASRKPASQALPIYLYGADHWRKVSA